MPSDAPRLVVGAIIVDDLDHPTQVFAARRTRPAELAGLWEFPGGKVEDGETPETALVREIREELAATVTIGPELRHPAGAWPVSAKYEMRLFFAAVTDGEIAPGDSHDRTQWVAPERLHALDLIPPDAGAIGAIQRSVSGRTENQPSE